MLVKTVILHCDGTKRHDYHQQPLEIFELKNRAVEKTKLGTDKANRVRSPKCERKDECVHDFEKLQIKFLSAAYHVRRDKFSPYV
jgi:hypothetical protein